jgi:tetratricopeptide (TPR) repeat protein
MRMQLAVRTAAALTIILGLGLSSVACSKINELKGTMRFREANAAYQTQDYARAIPLYEETLANDPSLVAVHFFLGNSYENLYKPGFDDPENVEYLNKAIAQYELAAEKLTTDTPDSAQLKMLSLQYLASAYGSDKLNDPTRAEPVIQRMIQLAPGEVANYFALSKLYEDAGLYDEAEQILMYAKDAQPNDPNVYVQVGAFYNRMGRFDDTIAALEERARLEPNNPEAFFTISTYYWDNAQRNVRLQDAEKMENVKKGLTAVERALEIRPEYMEALVYKGLLLRVQANLEKDPAVQQALIKQAVALQDQAEEIRKKSAAGLVG